MCRVSVWDSATASRADGLWEAAVAGRAGEAAVKLKSKTATWSSTTESFELDLLEVHKLFILVVLEDSLGPERHETTIFFSSRQPCPTTSCEHEVHPEVS